MARALARFVPPLDLQLELARMLIVTGAALALILAGRALPF